jgi:hypothetical protein
MTRLDRRISWGIFGLLLCSYAYFYQAGGWNENSRMDLVRAIVEDHTLSIDRYHLNTGDKALFGGHYYSDKAPGLSLLAAPLYFVIRLLRPLFHTEHDFVVVASYLITVLTVGVAGAALGALVFRAGRKLGATPEGALIAAVGYGLGSAAFPLSTMLFSHQLSALLLFSAFLLAWEGSPGGAARTRLPVALIASAAVLVEYPTAPAALGIVLFHMGAKPSRRTLSLLAVAALPVLVLAAYLFFAFRSPVRVGYDLLADPASRAEMHSHGLFGVTYPKIDVLAELVFGRYRGLLPYSPVLALAIPGFLGALSQHGTDEGAAPPDDATRRATLVALGVVVYFLLFVSSYAWWEGGASFGSRHLAPMLPFFAMPVALVASRRPRLAFVLLVPSIAVMTIVTSVQPKPSDWVKDPFWAQILPSFVHGALAMTRACPAYGNPLNPAHHPFLAHARYDAFNLGMLLGGRGLRSLAPLLALWGTSLWAFRNLLREEPEGEEAASKPAEVTSS